MQERHYAGRYLRLQVLLIADLARRWMTRTVSSSVAQSFTTFSLEPSASNACCTDIDNVTACGCRRRDAKAGTTRLPRSTPSLSGDGKARGNDALRAPPTLLAMWPEMGLCPVKVGLGVGLGGMCGNKHLTNPGPHMPYFLIGYPHRIMPLRL